MNFQVCGIYKIENLINAKKYIGQSIDIERRFREHKKPYKRINPTKELYIAFNEFGIENFSFEIIEECSQELLNEREKYWIEYYDSLNNGYNMSTIENLQKKFDWYTVKEVQEKLMNTTISNQDLANEYQASNTWISLVNKGELWYNKKLSYPLRPIKKGNKNFCIDCGKPVSYRSKRCVECAKIASRKVERPSREELKDLIRNKPFTQIAKEFGVYDSTIRRWCNQLELPSTKREINTYTDEEWSKI